ncbi:MAG: hypothetical protein VKJ02_12905 [Snowella sp.]|nr:hypothetical protein [Snowella sp.]
MLLLHCLDVSTIGLSGIDHLLDHHSFSLLSHQVLDWTTLLAQNISEIKKIDIIADFQKSFQNFIKSGQVWALGIGLVLGWVLKGFLG